MQTVLLSARTSYRWWAESEDDQAQRQDLARSMLALRRAGRPNFVPLDGGVQLVLCDDPEELYANSRRDPQRLFFQHAQKSGATHSPALMYAASQSRRQWELFEPEFVAALPVLEAYSPATKPAASQSLWALTLRSNRIDDPDSEEIVRRWNFGQDLLQLFIVSPNITASIDFMGIVEEIPDLNGPEWQEWVPPPRDHAQTLAPFRIYPQTPQGYQWTVLFYQPPDWWIEAAQDTPQSREHFEQLNAFRQTYPAPVAGHFPAVQLGIFEIEGAVVATGTGSITLTWSASPGAAGYRLYINGEPENQITSTLGTFQLTAAASSPYVGYGSAGFGTLSPPTDWNGNSVLLMADSAVGGPNFFFLITSGASLLRNYFDSISIVGPGVNVNLASSAAAYFYNSGSSQWNWAGELGLVAGDTYTVTCYRSNPFIMPFGQQKRTITGLPLNTQFTYAIVAVNGLGIDSSPLSNVVTFEHSSNELTDYVPLSSDNPGEDR